ncbi:hypothetical protein ACLOJK_006443 [Asimina triloba]
MVHFLEGEAFIFDAGRSLDAYIAAFEHVSLHVNDLLEIRDDEVEHVSISLQAMHGGFKHNMKLDGTIEQRWVAVFIDSGNIENFIS